MNESFIIHKDLKAIKILGILSIPCGLAPWSMYMGFEPNLIGRIQVGVERGRRNSRQQNPLGAEVQKGTWCVESQGEDQPWQKNGQHRRVYT